MTPLRAAIQPYPLLLGLGAFDAAGYSVIVPVAPAVADATGAGPTAIGLLVASFAAGMVAGFALAGWGVTRHGSKPVLVVSLGWSHWALSGSSSANRSRSTSQVDS